MKTQSDRTIHAHLLRSGFYMLLFLAVCVIPFALAQRNTTGRTFATRVPPSAASAPESQSPALSSWSIVANYPAVIQSPAVSTDGTYAYSGGGSDNFVPIDGFYRYDPVADMWTTLASLPQALFDARAAYAANVNKIYVFGGIDAGFNVLNTTYIYDIETDSWTTGTAMPEPRFFPTVATMALTEKFTLSLASTSTSSKPVKPGSMIRLLTHGTHPAQVFQWEWEAALPALLTKTFIWRVLLAQPAGRHFITVTTS